MTDRAFRPSHRAAAWLATAAIVTVASTASAADRPHAPQRPVAAMAAAPTLARGGGDGEGEPTTKSHGRSRVVHASRARRATHRARTRRVSRAAAGAAWASPRGDLALRSDLADMLTSKTRGGRWGAIVVSLTRGDTLFEENADAKLQPASTMKLMTTAVALDRFGPEHHFTTAVLHDGTVAAGTLQGNLYLRGGGDPSLSSRYVKDGEALPMDSLARLVAATGIKHVHGDIVADASEFENKLIPDGWQKRYLHASYAAPVSALSINENLMWIVVSPAGKSANVALDPATTAIPIVNHVRVVGGSGGRIVARRTSDGSIDVTGSIGARSAPRRWSYVIDDPVTYAGGALKAALQAAGVTVDGTVRVGATPAQAPQVAAIQSPALGQLLSAMNRESINHFAELFFRDAAHAAEPNEPGSAVTGQHVLREFLAGKVGADSNWIHVTDGSGLSVNDSLTPRLMVELLGYAHKSPWSSTFHASLPVAGESELLKRRMRYTPAQGNLHAKTGTTNVVSALAGYVTAKDGEVIAFSFIYNGADRWNAKATMDRMGATLADFLR